MVYSYLVPIYLGIEIYTIHYMTNFTIPNTLMGLWCFSDAFLLFSGTVVASRTMELPVTISSAGNGQIYLCRKQWILVQQKVSFYYFLNLIHSIIIY